MWGVLGHGVQTTGSPRGATLERFSLHPWAGSDPREEATSPLPEPHTFTAHHLKPCKYITFHFLLRVFTTSLNCLFIKTRAVTC